MLGAFDGFQPSESLCCIQASILRWRELEAQLADLQVWVLIAITATYNEAECEEDTNKSANLGSRRRFLRLFLCPVCDFLLHDGFGCSY